MKPCSKNRKPLALLALGNLDAEQSTALRDHVATCEGCRRYLDELAKVTASISGAEMKVDIVATASFHRKVVAAVTAEERRFVWPAIEGFLHGTLLNWRIAIPTVSGIAVALVVGLLLMSRQRPDVLLPAPSSAQGSLTHNLDADFRPTIGHYRMVANQSLEKFDQVLSEQGNRKLPPAPIYTASAFMAADVSN
jgi:anti-sigma factor RsiW